MFSLPLWVFVDLIDCSLQSKTCNCSMGIVGSSWWEQLCFHLHVWMYQSWIHGMKGARRKEGIFSDTPPASHHRISIWKLQLSCDMPVVWTQILSQYTICAFSVFYFHRSMNLVLKELIAHNQASGQWGRPGRLCFI